MGARFLLAAALSLPLAAWAAGPRAARGLDAALSACDHSVFQSSANVVNDYAAYRQGLEIAARGERGVRQAGRRWASPVEPRRSFPVGEWISRCDRWYADTARDELRFAILLCEKAHRGGTSTSGPDLLREAANAYRDARENALALDPAVASRGTDRIRGEAYSTWVNRCDAWFAAHAPPERDLAEELPTLVR